MLAVVVFLDLLVVLVVLVVLDVDGHGALGDTNHDGCAVLELGLPGRHPVRVCEGRDEGVSGRRAIREHNMLGGFVASVPVSMPQEDHAVAGIQYLVSTAKSESLWQVLDWCFPLTSRSLRALLAWGPSQNTDLRTETPYVCDWEALGSLF